MRRKAHGQLRRGQVITTYGPSGSTKRLGTLQAVDVQQSTGNVYVADVNKLIHVYDASGNWIRTFSVSDRPAGIEVSGTTVYLLSWRISEYSIADTVSSSTPTPTVRFGSFNAPYVGIAVDAAGNVYVGDSENHRVEVFAP